MKKKFLAGFTMLVLLSTSLNVWADSKWGTSGAMKWGHTWFIDTDADTYDDNYDDAFPGNTAEWSDEDGDRMGDNFETDYAGLPASLSSSNPNDALLDPDGDGYCNLREFISSSNPGVADPTLPVIADIEPDSDVDAVDLASVRSDFNSTDCATTPCPGDFDGNDAVDQVDLKLFSEDYGRAN